VNVWDTSCPDWTDRIRRGRSLVPSLPLCADAADRAEAIFGNLQLPDVIGKPRMRDATGQWQRDLIRALFGSYDHDAGVRHLREFFVMVPKKSSKTTAGSAIMLCALLMNRRPRAEFLIVAPTQQVSELAFGQAVGMIEADPVLAAKMQVREHVKTIVFRSTGATLKIKSFDPKIVTGVRPSGILIDELHVIAEATDADRVIGQLRGGMVSQPEAFMLTITTQSERPPSGVFKAELGKARAVRDGRLSSPLLPMLYEFPPGVEWRDPANWPMVLPNNGYSINVARLVPDYEAAVESGDHELRRWASQHLCIEVGLGLRSDGWSGADLWDGRGDPALTLDELLERSEVAAVGIDGGGLDDLLGLAVIGRDKRTREWLHWGRAWASRIVLERRKSEAPRLRDFERDGDLFIVDMLGEDIAEVVETVARVDAAGLLHAVGLDPVGIGAIVDALAERGIDGDRVVGISQGWRLAGAIKTVERKLADGTFTHGAQPLMAYAVGNAKVEPKGNAIAITKATAGSAKIDPLMALFDAAALMATNPAAREHQMFFVS
jgi:phage terminase large subunit-like protein